MSDGLTTASNGSLRPFSENMEVELEPLEKGSVVVSQFFYLTS